MTDREKQYLRDIAEGLLETIETEPFPCDFCKHIKQMDYIRTDYMVCPVIYCPACGRVLTGKETENA